MIANINPFSLRSGGSVATTAGEEIPATITNLDVQNFTETYIIGVDPSYFDTFDLFSSYLSSEQISDIFDNFSNRVIYLRIFIFFKCCNYC